MDARKQAYLDRIWEAIPEPSPEMHAYVTCFRRAAVLQDTPSHDAAQAAYRALSGAEREQLRAISRSLE